MKAKNTLLLNNTITPNPILARRGSFFHLASQLSGVTLFISCACGFLVKVQTKFQLPTVVHFCGIHTPTTDTKIGAGSYTAGSYMLTFKPQKCLRPEVLDLRVWLWRKICHRGNIPP